MKVKVQLLYDGKPSRDLTVEVRDGLKGERLLNAIDRQVEKTAGDDWKRWNLFKIMPAVALLVALAGCASQPAYLACAGKGKVTASVDVLAYSSKATVDADCGEGFLYTRTPVAPPPSHQP